MFVGLFGTFYNANSSLKKQISMRVSILFYFLYEFMSLRGFHCYIHLYLGVWHMDGVVRISGMDYYIPNS